MAKLYLKTKAGVTILFLLFSIHAFSQARISGKVISTEDGSGLPGVSILEKGTSNGTVTDTNGNYAITTKEGATLVYSFIGYTTQEVPVNGRSTIDIGLEVSISSLQEVVVIGYGEQEKKDVTGSVLALSSRDFNKGIMSSPQDLMIGKIAGVQVSTNSGAPGSGAVIRIRGNGSIGGSQDPLIVIDGFPVDNNNIGGLDNKLAAINPNDIESFTVLKDASATAIYGLRASNGVILITTKKGKEGKPQLTYNGNVSVSSPMKYVDVLTGDEMRALGNTLLAENLPGLTPDALQRMGDENTDWQREIYRDAISHDHNIGIAGTHKEFPYRISYGYTDQQGILRTTSFERNSLNINLTPTFFDGDLKVTATMKGSHTKQNFGNTEAIGAAVAFDPTQPIRNGSTRWGGFFTWVAPASATTLDPNGEPLTLATSNPVALLEQTDNRSSVWRGLANVQLDYRLRFFPAIKLTMNAGIDYASADGHNNAPVNAAWIFENGGGQRIDYTGINKSKLLDLYANYTKEFGKSKFDVTAGYSYQSFERDGTNFGRNAQSGDALIYTDYQTDVVNGDSVAVPRKFVSNPNYLVSFFGRLNYSFNDKYLVTVSFRDDASSRFSEDNRWKIFPAAAIGWNISKESFLSPVKAITNLKLRASYGVTGNQDVTNIPYPYLSTYQLSSSTSQYQFGNTFYNTFRPQPYDADIRWETTTQFDVGIDFGLFNDRITGTIDFYKKDTDDLINSIPVPAGSNFSNFLLTNVGSMVNKGYEITINTVPVRKEKFEWNFGFNFTYNENEVTKLLKTEDPNYPGVQVGGIGLQRFIQNIQVGYPVNTFLVFKQVYTEAGVPVEGLYVDRSGLGGDVTANENNKFRYQKPQPDYLIGVNTRLSYSNWDLYLSGRASIGNYVYNNIHTGANYSNFFYSTGYFNNLPRAVNETNFTALQSFSDYYLENASFFKMDNISLGYNVNELFSSKLKARVSFTVQNAFFITDYKGLDPEVNNVNTATNQASSGIDNNIYPRARVFLLGVNLTY